MPELPSTPQQLANRGPLTRAVILLFILGLLFSLCFIFVGFHNSLYDFHGFRQTQTAISVESMLHGGPLLRYETPVLGPPWSIPFEFPLYQWIVAWTADHLSTRIDETGRAISILFFYLSFLPFSSILRRLRFKPVQIAAVLALFAVNPLYIFVSRLFMIESTALFLSLLYVDQVFRLSMGDKTWRYRNMVLGATFGVLAGVVKVTTFAPFFVLGSCVAAWLLWKSYRTRAARLTQVVSAVVLDGLLPLICTDLWTRFADAEKEKNPIGRYLTSTDLRSWNFGTLHQRLQLTNYVHFWKAADVQIGSLVLVALLVGLYAGLFQRWNRTALIAVALYVGTFLLFFNLHLEHTYYPYSNLIFLIAAVGTLIAEVLLLPGRKAWLGVGLLALLMVACAYRYHSNFLSIQAHNAPGRPAATAIIDQTTASDAVILIAGLDWSSELPYQAHRRAIMDTVRLPGKLFPTVNAIDAQGPQTIPEVVVCADARGTERTKQLLQIVGIDATASLHADDCDIYLRNPQ